MEHPGAARALPRVDARGRSTPGSRAVVVVDNVSADGSAELVRERFGWAELIEAERNLGFGAAVNARVEGATTPWLAPANADVELRPGALEALLAAGRDHPEAGLLAPTLIVPGGSIQHSVHAFPSLELALAFNLGLGGRDAPARRPALPRGPLGPGAGPRDRLGPRRVPTRAPRRVRGHRRLRRRPVDVRGGPRPRAGAWPRRGGHGGSCPRRGWATRSRRRPASGSATTSGPRPTWRRPRTGWPPPRAGRRGAYAAINALGSALRLLALAPLRPGQPPALRRPARARAALPAPARRRPAAVGR